MCFACIMRSEEVFIVCGSLGVACVYWINPRDITNNDGANIARNSFIRSYPYAGTVYVFKLRDFKYVSGLSSLCTGLENLFNVPVPDASYHTIDEGVIKSMPSGIDRAIQHIMIAQSACHGTVRAKMGFCMKECGPRSLERSIERSSDGHPTTEKSQ